MNHNDKLPPGPLPDSLCRAVAAAPSASSKRHGGLVSMAPDHPLLGGPYAGEGNGFDWIDPEGDGERPIRSKGVEQAERDRSGLIELLEYAATYLSHPDVRPIVDRFALPGSALAARCREASAALESEARRGE